MTEIEVGLPDTSVFIARESGRPIAKLPERVALSVITIGELQLGVLNAVDALTRSRRADTLAPRARVIRYRSVKQCWFRGLDLSRIAEPPAYIGQ